MKEFNYIMSGQLDNPSSSIKNNLSDYDDKLVLQKILIEESCQRHLNCMRLMQMRHAQLRNKHKTKKVSVTALIKQFTNDC